MSFGRLFNWGDKKKKCRVAKPSLEKLTDPKVLKQLTPEQRKILDEKVIPLRLNTYLFNSGRVELITQKGLQVQGQKAHRKSTDESDRRGADEAPAIRRC